MLPNEFLASENERATWQLSVLDECLSLFYCTLSKWNKYALLGEESEWG